MHAVFPDAQTNIQILTNAVCALISAPPQSARFWIRGDERKGKKIYLIPLSGKYIRVYTVAEQAGFVSVKHFNTVYKKYYDVTPKEFSKGQTAMPDTETLI